MSLPQESDGVDRAHYLMQDLGSGPERFDLTIAAQIAELEDSSDQHFPATDLIRTLLIYHISATTELSTHLHLSRQLVLRCTRAFEAIHHLMVVSSQPRTPINWDLFDAYTRGIPILESVLLSFETADLSTQQKHRPDDDDILGALRFIELWSQDRTQLVEGLKRLASDEFLGLWKGDDADTVTKEVLHNTRSLLQSTPFLEIARDDLTTLMVHWEFFETFSSELSSAFDAIPKSFVTDILHAMRNISRALHSQSLIDQNPKDNIQQAFSSPHYVFAQIFIRSLMLITVPFALLSKGQSNPKFLDDSVKRHLARGELWTEMQRLAKLLLDAVNDKSKRENLKPFEEEYARLRTLLLSNLPTPSDLLVNETLQLLRLSTQVFRRFQQRTVALIRLLHYLDQESSTKSAPLDTRDEVRKAFQESIGLLEVTEKKFRGISLRASVTADEYNERATAFEEVFTKLRQSYKLLDPSNSWLSKEADFLAAVELDETHMKEFQLV